MVWRHLVSTRWRQTQQRRILESGTELLRGFLNNSSHLGGGPGHAWPVHVFLSGLHYKQLLLLTDLFGQNADLLHLFVLAVIV